MSDPDQIRADIERTRGDLSYDVDALSDKVRPSSVAHRQADKVRSRFGDARDRVMGAVHDAQGSTGSGLSSAGDAVAGAPQRAKQATQGNPLAVGLIAFGAGWLVSSLIPASRAETDLAGTVKEKAAPLQQKVTEVAKDVGQNLKEPAQQAAQSVRETATDAAQNVRESGRSAASDVRDSAQSSAEQVRDS
jgi:hypothetical protein